MLIPLEPLNYFPLEKKTIGYKLIFKTKLKTYVSIKRYKTQLVVKGYNQIECLDYHENFASVAKITTIRCLLAVNHQTLDYSSIRCS